jgi:hypothetical protein
MTRLDIDPAGFIIFLLEEEKEWVGLEKFLCSIMFQYVPTGVPHVPNEFLIKSLKFLILRHFIPYPLPKGFPFLTYMAQSKGRHSILT